MVRLRLTQPAGSLVATASLTLGLGLHLLVPAALRAGQPWAEFPPSETFRTLRLVTLACGRDNTPASCDKARAMADPLLDHPRLPATCKDVLWRIRELSVAAPANSFARRDPIDAAGQDVLVFCRQQPVKAKEETPAAPPAQGSGGSGFGFGAPPR